MVTTTLRPWSVLLLYPDYIAEDFGSETYYALVRADCAASAIDAAQREAVRDNRANGARLRTREDFFPLLVIRGHHPDRMPAGMGRSN